VPKNKPPIYSKTTVKGKEGRGWGGSCNHTYKREERERERESARGRDVTVR